MKYPIVIIGAGASGLMAALDLARAGRKVLVIEARDRLGGRIFTLKNFFGNVAEAGAEFIHGEAPMTMALAREAGLEIIKAEGEMWSAENGRITRPEASPYEKELREKLKNLETDIPIQTFLDNNFSDPKYSDLRQNIISRVEGFDAADPKSASTLAIKEEWLGGGEEDQYRIKEGYGAIIDYLAAETKKNGAEIRLKKEAADFNLKDGFVEIKTSGGEIIAAGKVLLTAPLPKLKELLIPSNYDQIKEAEKIGYGGVLKILIRFDKAWWKEEHRNFLKNMSFIFSGETIPTWWTQYPEDIPLLTGWLGGPDVLKLSGKSSQEILKAALSSLGAIFSLDVGEINNQIVESRIYDWTADKFSSGAYSYATTEAEGARKKLLEPIQDLIYLAGEALYSGKEIGTVEAALSSGRIAAGKML